jgi:hypothetical protein
VCLILKEHRYVVQVGAVNHVLRIEELVSGPALWRAKFRLNIPADLNRQAEILYGASADEVAELGADFLGGRKPKAKSPMSTPQLTKLMAEFQTLKAQFMRSTDPAERVELLEKIGLVINELDRAIIERMTKLANRII